MAFLTTLGKVVNEQFGMGERVGNIGQLGDLSKKIDQSAQRTYIEDGLINNTRPRMREVLFQQPDITVVLKKRMFSSLIENNRLDLMEEKEKLLLRATKRLFHNKCKLISAYERLTKIEKVTEESGMFNTYLVPVALQAIEDFERAGLNIVDPDTRAALDTLRKAIAFSDASNFTNWSVDYESAFSGELGDGTGTIELTNVSSINTNVSVKFGQGNCSFTIEDPYKLMHITNADIDRAIAESASIRSGPFFKFTEIETKNLVDRLKNELSDLRVSRGVGDIRFIINPVAINEKKVRAVVDGVGKEIIFTYNAGIVGIGGSVDIDPVSLTDRYGLLDQEVSIFKEIVKNIYLIIGLEETTKANLTEFNQEMNYVRNRMRLFFGKKSIVQVMDVVNVFVTTHTSEDSKLTEGFPGFQTTGQLHVGQKLNNLIRNINTTFQNSFGSGISPDELEKAAIVGPNFPTWLWRMFKNNFTREAAGTAVFVGLVREVTQSYDDGKYLVSVNCSDNTGYFNKSQINVKPSLDAFNSTLYDPLTPFDVSFDGSTGVPIDNVFGGAFPPLLPENLKLLQTKSLKFNTTDLRGQKANQILYNTKRGEIVFGKVRRVLSDADGFVYRWKQGIQTSTKTERAAPVSSIQDERSPLLTKEAFAGQDVMNVLSLLITGQPYNFNTFLKAAISNANNITAYNPYNNTDSSISFIDGLIRDLSKRNVIWGNFVPFKGLSLNDEAFKFIQSGQTSFIRQNQELQKLIRERAALQDQKVLRLSGLSTDPQIHPRDENGNPLAPSVEAEVLGPEIASIDERIDELDRKIAVAEGDFNSEINNIYASNKANIKIIGDDISLEPGFNEFSGDNAISEEQRSLSRAELRRKINSLTRRQLWKVKANNDTNLFVVDDQYDKSFDIMAFERALSSDSMKLFSSDYLTVDQQIETVANLLGLEVFADSQGNIQARPPMYNKMPSSVFFKMFKDRAESGIKVFPDFLETLLFNQVNGVTDKIEIVEDQIRLRAIALGISGDNEYLTDIAIQKFLRSNANSPGSSGTGFQFLTNPKTGKIPPEKYANASMQSNPELLESEDGKTLAALEGLNKAARTQLQSNRIFDFSSRIRSINENTAPAQSNEKIKYIRDRLQKNKGVKTPTISELFSNKSMNLVTGAVSSLDRLNVFKQISELVSERQKLVKQLSNITKNLVEGLKINNTDDGAKTALTPFLNRKNNIPSFLEHMIEDETLDDLGPGSGSRFVIKESQIVRFKLIEKEPDFTATQVNGKFGEGFVDVPGSLSTDRGGNAITSAYAVDYDMWRQYGLRFSNSIEAPFFSDPNSQCAPYAVSLLNRARKKIFSGSLSIVGKNEFYQAGDVIYIEDYDLLFYVDSVSHGFSYDSTFITTLELSYGHNPGEYIPTPLDIIGSYLYKSQGFSNQFRSSRFDVFGDNISLGALVIDPMNPTLNGLLSGSVGKQNKQILSQILFGASGALNPVNFKNSQAKLQLRLYSETDNADPILLNISNDVINWLTNPQKNDSLTNSIESDNIDNNFVLDPSNIDGIEVININNDSRSPSRSAWNTVRLMRGERSFHSLNSGEVATSDDTILFYGIIDIWMVFTSVSNNLVSSNQNNQLAQEDNQLLNDATRN